MRIDRRQLLVTGGAWLASLAGRPRRPRAEDAPLDALLDAHAEMLPERAGAGANHYTMAAEALEALGLGDSIDVAWIEGAEGYAGELQRSAPIEDEAAVRAALGSYERFGDWLDFFRGALDERSWSAVVAEWAPRLAPGMVGATFHGLIRAGHAVRALRTRETAARRRELAIGLAYWAARYTELPTRDAPVAGDGSVAQELARLDYPYVDVEDSVGFFDVIDRLVEPPLAAPVRKAPVGETAEAELAELVTAAAAGFLEMLVLERYRIWLLHTVTGPACVGLLLPEVDERDARTLVAYARQAVVALYAAYGTPYKAREHVRPAPAPWPELIETAVGRGYVHSVKLVEALARFAPHDDLLFRSVAELANEWD